MDGMHRRRDERHRPPLLPRRQNLLADRAENPQREQLRALGHDQLSAVGLVHLPQPDEVSEPPIHNLIASIIEPRAQLTSTHRYLLVVASVINSTGADFRARKTKSCFDLFSLPLSRGWNLGSAGGL